jgi:hypothetical protein
MKKVKTAQQFIPKKFSPPPVNTDKKTPEFKFGIELKEIQGKMNFEPAFVITMTGEKASIRSGLIRAMFADETFAKHITLAAEYFKTIEK